MNPGLGLSINNQHFEPNEIAQVATPTMSVATGVYNNDQSVTLVCATDGATIRYTLDGSDPTSSSTAYTTAITINATATNLKARAFKSGMADSEVASETYTLQVAEIVINPVAGDYTTQQGVTLTTTTTGASIYYTTDGSDVTLESTLYTGAITMPLTDVKIFKAAAVKTGYVGGALGEAVLIRVATPETDFTFKEGAVDTYLGAGGTVIIPAYTTDGNTITPVTGITAGAFISSDVTNLYIPNTFLAIPDDALSNLTLTLVHLGSGVLLVGTSALEGCTSLIQVFLLGTNGSVWDNAFRDCPLTNVVIGAGWDIGTNADTMGTNAGFRAAYLIGGAGNYRWDLTNGWYKA